MMSCQSLSPRVCFYSLYLRPCLTLIRLIGQAYLQFFKSYRLLIQQLLGYGLVDLHHHYWVYPQRKCV